MLSLIQCLKEIETYKQWSFKMIDFQVDKEGIHIVFLENSLERDEEGLVFKEWPTVHKTLDWNAVKLYLQMLENSQSN